MDLITIDENEVEKNKEEFSVLLSKAMKVSLEIINEDKYIEACDLLLKIKQRRKFWDTFNKPIKQSIDYLKKQVLDREKMVAEPLERAEIQYLKPAMAEYDRKKSEERRIKEEMMRAEFVRKEEEGKILLAEQFAKQGNSEEADRILNEKINVPVLSIAENKVEGISFSEIWRFEIENGDLIPKEYLLVDEKKIGQVVRALKDKCNIPGIRVYPEKIVRAKGESYGRTENI